jgi:hypothetical protein
MNSPNIDSISKSPLILEFTKVVFENFYHITFPVQEKQVIDTSLVSNVSPTSFQGSLVSNQQMEIKSPEKSNVRYIEGRPMEVRGVLKLQPLFNDPSISLIECQGANTPVIITRRGMKQITKISLSSSEIVSVLEEFTDKSNIPLVEGVVHVVSENLELKGLYSDLIRSNFVISRI